VEQKSFVGFQSVVAGRKMPRLKLFCSATKNCCVSVPDSKKNTPQEQTMRHTAMKLATFVFVVAMMLAASGRLWAQETEDSAASFSPDSTSVRLSARNSAIINGIRAELRGDYRADGTTPVRLNAQLENVNLPIGTPVAFCILQDGVKKLAGRGKVALVAGIRTAKIDLAVTDGEHVPFVKAGDTLQARQTKIAPFNLPPSCGSPLLIGAKFQ
jgi:hypothetical protein